MSGFPTDDPGADACKCVVSAEPFPYKASGQASRRSSAEPVSNERCAAHSDAAFEAERFESERLTGHDRGRRASASAAAIARSEAMCVVLSLWPPGYPLLRQMWPSNCCRKSSERPLGQERIRLLRDHRTEQIRIVKIAAPTLTTKRGIEC
jgi:hypothetical protein